MSWLSNILPGVKSKSRAADSERNIPEGLWGKCGACGATSYLPDGEKNLWVCPACDHHERITAEQRAKILFDEGTAEELFANLRTVDMLKFDDGTPYAERLQKAQGADAGRESARAYRGEIYGAPVAAVIFDFSFMGGSMGVVAGERFARAAEYAAREKLPFLSFASSGGARMQEGLSSLLQMAKTTAALSALSTLRLPYISVLADPTTGGVAASFAMIGDIIIAEPNALVGFAGPRVIQETVRERLPDGFQRSEFLLSRGAVDMICDRREMRGKFRVLLPLLSAR